MLPDSIGIPHQGFGIHLADFGSGLSKALAESFVANHDLMCRSGPRFRMYVNIIIEDPILIFDPPLEYNPDGTDVDPSKVIGNPGKLANFNSEHLCDPVKNIKPT